MEGKARAASNVLEQALVRRPWGDWVAVAVGSERAAHRLVSRTAGRRAEFVGVWSVAGGVARELRPPGQTHRAGEEDPFSRTRAQLRRALDGVDSGEVPVGVRWSGVQAAVARSSAGRRFREWRLDERLGPGV